MLNSLGRRMTALAFGYEPKKSQQDSGLRFLRITNC